MTTEWIAALLVTIVTAGFVIFWIGYRIGGVHAYRDGYGDCKRINDPANYSLTRVK